MVEIDLQFENQKVRDLILYSIQNLTLNLFKLFKPFLFWQLICNTYYQNFIFSFHSTIRIWIESSVLPHFSTTVFFICQYYRCMSVQSWSIYLFLYVFILQFVFLIAQFYGSVYHILGTTVFFSIYGRIASLPRGVF